MRAAYSEESINAVKLVVDTMRRGDGITWKELEHVLGVKQGRLRAFMDDTTDEVPKLLGMRSILDGIARYVSQNENTTNLRSLCSTELEIVLGKTPHPLEFIKSRLKADDDAQRQLSEGMAGGYLVARPSKRGALLVGHLHVIDTFGMQGLTSAHMRRELTVGDELSIKAAIYKKDSKINVVGIENMNKCFRTVALRQVGDNMSLLRGVMSGYEIDGTAFACKTVMGRLKKDWAQYSVFRDMTGIYDEDRLKKLSDLVLETCTKAENVNSAIGEIRDGYIAQDLEDD